jgi:hypothetical protein
VSSPLTRDQLETVARVHVTAEVTRLVMSALPVQPIAWRPENGLAGVDLSDWFDELRLEAAMVHMRCLHSFLTGLTRRRVGPYGTDVVAQDFFRGHWTPPVVVIGADAAEQQRVIESLDTRIHHIGRDRLSGPYTREQARQHTPQLLAAFGEFVTALASDGAGERAEWFLEAVRFAKHLEI